VSVSERAADRRSDGEDSFPDAEDYGSDARVLSRPEHPISRKKVSQSALKVLYRLHNAGHRAYLVGGGVRDLLLSRQPKDFDIATDATPQQVRRLFRNSRIIGRRFRLVHVMFREGVVEVSTFRAPPKASAQDRDRGELLVTDDNVWGSPRQDAYRRDFTINALFYNIADFTVIDYVDGVEDLHRGIIRVIGEPKVRFHEDPVRMLRACEFAGRLDFTIERRTQEAIEASREEIYKASPHRLTEELLELLRSGHSAPTLQWMLDLGLVELVLPELESVLDGGAGEEFVGLFAAIDHAVAEGGAFSDIVLLAVLLAPRVILERARIERDGPASRRDLAAINEDAVASFTERFAVSNQRRVRLLAALETFQRLCEEIDHEKQRVKIAKRPSFSDALDLFELLVEATGDGQDVYEEWRQTAVRARKQGGPRKGGGKQGGAEASGSSRRKRRRPRRRRRRR
jgi:poly(A) polymerase